ncbi:MAG: VWA domain-containing protein [Phycisphaerales bacterium]|nr:VWA domain-containing protein [Phycisphaerales bacterium]
MTPFGFTYPWVLGFLLLPIALLTWWRGGRSRVAFPFDHAALEQRGWALWKSRAIASGLACSQGLPLLILIITIITLSVPQIMYRPPDGLSKRSYIQLLLDVSGSMGSETPSRYSNACLAIDELSRARERATANDHEGDAMGVMFFGLEQLRWVPMTEDLQVVRSALEFANPERQPPNMGGTRIGAALKYAAGVMAAESGETGERVLILISDGDSFDVLGGRQYELAAVLRDARIRLFYIHVGNDMLPVAECMEIATMTGGHSFAARDRAATLDVMRQIDRLTKVSLTPRASVQVDFFRPFARALLALTCLHVVFLFGVRWTPW